MGKERGPEWKHVKVVEAKPKGDSKLLCAHCQKEFWGGAVRIRAHLLGNNPVAGVAKCPSTPQAVIDELTALEKAKVDSQKKKRSLEALDALTKESSGSSQKRQVSIQSSVSGMNKEGVDEAWALALYANGVPFNFVRSPYFKEALKKTGAFGSSYGGPSYNALREGSLDKAKQKIEKEMEPLVESLEKSGCTIASDGWTNTQSRPLLNLLMVCPRGEVFLRAVNTEGATKDAPYTAAVICEAIEEVSRRSKSAESAVLALVVSVFSPFLCFWTTYVR
jgi:hypothetical protein